MPAPLAGDDLHQFNAFFYRIFDDSLQGCFKGFTVTGGTEGVGVATTQTVAVTAVGVCVSDFLLTKLLLAFG